MGFGGIMIHPSVFEKIPYPRFQGGWNWEVGSYIGEDTKFYHNCTQFNIDIWCDTDLSYGHIHTAPIEFSKSETGEIPGWTTDAELEWLTEAAKRVDTIVEIGSWKGRSTRALLEGNPKTVWAVDHFKGSPSEMRTYHREAKDEDIYEIFMKNVGHYENLEVLKMDSVEASKQFEDKSVDMVFIDGEHTYDAVVRDIEAWLPKVKVAICGHDYWIDEVKQAVGDTLGEVATIESIWIKEIG